MIPTKRKIHYMDKDLLFPTNPVSINLIGAGGTGSKMLTALLELNHALIELNHPGLDVRLWDDDIITPANVGRQRFAHSEIGMNKAVALINRANRWLGTRWKAIPHKFENDNSNRMPENTMFANIYISCVDNVNSRLELAEVLTRLNKKCYRDQPKYWLDIGNSRYIGQALLSTVGTIKQPESDEFETVGKLPFITEEYRELLLNAEKEDTTPSCSLAEALEQQDLYINGSLAQMASSLLWNLFRHGCILNKGFFHNIEDFRTQPIPVA